MKILQELLNENHPTLTDYKTRKVHVAIMTGGRGGDHVNTSVIDFPVGISPEEYEDLAEEHHELYELTPNDTNDVGKMIKAVSAGKIYADWDVGGDGAFAVGPKKKEVELALYRLLHRN